MFTPPDTPVPDGLCSVDFDEACFGVCWFYGDGSYDPGACAARLEDAGFKIGKDAAGRRMVISKLYLPALHNAR